MVWNQWWCLCFQVVANLIDLSNWSEVFANPTELENFALVVVELVAVEQAAARLIELVDFELVVASQIVPAAAFVAEQIAGAVAIQIESGTKVAIDLESAIPIESVLKAEIVLAFANRTV